MMLQKSSNFTARLTREKRLIVSPPVVYEEA